MDELPVSPQSVMDVIALLTFANDGQMGDDVLNMILDDDADLEEIIIVLVSLSLGVMDIAADNGGIDSVEDYLQMLGSSVLNAKKRKRDTNDDL